MSSDHLRSGTDPTTAHTHEHGGHGSDHHEATHPRPEHHEHTSQNPVGYCDLPEEAELRERPCGCGCGEISTSTSRRPRRARFEGRVCRMFAGSAPEFIRWVDRMAGRLARRTRPRREQSRGIAALTGQSPITRPPLIHRGQATTTARPRWSPTTSCSIAVQAGVPNSPPRLSMLSEKWSNDGGRDPTVIRSGGGATQQPLFRGFRTRIRHRSLSSA